MNARQLTYAYRPVDAWVCGCCSKAFEGPTAYRAEKCCTCWGCGRYHANDVARRGGWRCPQCAARLKWLQMWEDIGNEVFLSRLRSADVEGRVRDLLQDSE